MKIGLFYNNTNYNWGPGKLAKNTIQGLKNKNVEIITNDYGDYNLSICSEQFKNKFISHNVPNTLVGPCSMNTPRDFPSSFNEYSKFLVASEWYKKNWITYGIDENKIDVWFGGIDTDLFHPEKKIKTDCIIFLKNNDSNIFEAVKNVLNKLKLTYVFLHYGNYNEGEFIDLINSCKLGIIIHNTETQGFAIMEAMSMDLPLLVLDKNTWVGDKVFQEATSTPYFNNECGLKIKEKEITEISIEENLKLMLDNINTYKPRKFILENYTISDSINLLFKYYKI